MGPIIFCWVACGVNLAALVEVICDILSIELMSSCVAYGVKKADDTLPFLCRQEIFMC